jgi:plasmid stabilization system protein ParE
MIADIVVQRVLDATARLSDFPASGRVVPELGRADVREIIRGKYRVIYQLLEDRVRIVAVIHGARMLGGEAQE